MIIRCQDGGLLESAHVVQWESRAPQPKAKQVHTVIAKTVLGTDVQVFQGDAAECADYVARLERDVSEEPRMLRQLCNDLAKQDDTLRASIQRLAAIIGTLR